MTEIAKNFNFVNNNDYVFNKLIEKFDKNCFIFFFIFFCFSYEKLKTSKQIKKWNVEINMNNKLLKSCEETFDKNDRDKNQCTVNVYCFWILFIFFDLRSFNSMQFSRCLYFIVAHHRFFFDFFHENSFFLLNIDVISLLKIRRSQFFFFQFRESHQFHSFRQFYTIYRRRS